MIASHTTRGSDPSVSAMALTHRENARHSTIWSTAAANCFHGTRSDCSSILRSINAVAAFLARSGRGSFITSAPDFARDAKAASTRGGGPRAAFGMTRVRGFSLKRPQGQCNYTLRRNGHSGSPYTRVDRQFSTKTAHNSAAPKRMAPMGAEGVSTQVVTQLSALRATPHTPHQKGESWQLLKSQRKPSMPVETRRRPRVVEHAELDDIRIASGYGLGVGSRASASAADCRGR